MFYARFTPFWDNKFKSFLLKKSKKCTFFNIYDCVVFMGVLNIVPFDGHEIKSCEDFRESIQNLSFFLNNWFI